MKKTLHIAKSNILKNKNATASLFIIIMLVSALLTIGLSVIMGTEKDYYNGLERLHSLHSIVIMPQDVYNTSFEEFYKNDSRLTEYEVKNVLYTDIEKVMYGGEMEVSLLILNLDEEYTISPPKIVSEDLNVPEENAIYLPVFAKNVGYKLNDTFTFWYKNKQFDLTVAGFFESGEFKTANDGNVKLFVPIEAFAELNSNIPSQFCFTARLNDVNEAARFNKEFLEFTGIENEITLNVEAIQLSLASIMPVTIISAVLVVFAFLMAIIMLFFIHFRVSGSIHDAMQEIGVLKASGYTDRQIINCYVAEYGFISVSSAIIGVFLSLILFPAVRSVMESATGFKWALSSNIPLGLIIALILSIIILIMVFGSCKKVKAYSPVIALKGSMAISGFRKNFFPLKKGSSNVHTRLGLKNIFAFMKTYILISIIIIVSTFATVTVLGLYQAFTIDKEVFVKATGTELFDVEVQTAQHINADKLAEEISLMPEVRKTAMNDLFSQLYLDLDGERMVCMVSNDYSILENLKAYEGSMPIYDNEIAIPKTMSKVLNKTIGDTVEVYLNGKSLNYVITGLYSTSTAQSCAATVDGIQALNPNYERSQIGIYLNKDENIEDFIEKLEQQFGVVNVEYAGDSSSYQIEKITNMKEYVESNLGTYESIVSALVVVVGGVSLVIISVILSMTIKTIVTKRRKEFGILKAGGYTSRQLQFQIALSFIPFTIVSVILGGILGGVFFGPVFSATFESLGITGANVTVNIGFVTVAATIIFIITFIATNISARRIKNISVYELITK